MTLLIDDSTPILDTFIIEGKVMFSDEKDMTLDALNWKGRYAISALTHHHNAWELPRQTITDIWKQGNRLFSLQAEYSWEG